MVLPDVRICMISFPVIKAFSTPLQNLERTLRSAGFTVTGIIGYEEMPALGNSGETERYLIPFNRRTGSQVLHQISFILLQFRIGVRMLWISRETDLFFFFMQTGPIIPLIVARLLGKKTVWMLPSSMERMAQYQQYTLSGVILRLQQICYRMVDTLVLYSADLIDEWGLRAHQGKIRIAHEHIVDTARFSVEVPVPLRGQVIGFVGRFSEEKGIISLLEAIGEVYQRQCDLRFLLIGDGPCMGVMRAYISEHHLDSAVTLLGWVETVDLPQYLNQMALMVLPSVTEGLPNVMLEAMACGTPVLASGVGAIPAVIRDGQNGYLLKERSVTGIVDGLLSALSDPARAEVAVAARKSIEESFSLERTAEEMKNVLSAIYRT